MLRGLSPDSGWAHALYPVDPTTGERARREQVAPVDDPDEIEAFFARGNV